MNVESSNRSAAASRRSESADCESEQQRESLRQDRKVRRGSDCQETLTSPA